MPDFWTAIIRVVIFGLLILGVGFSGLFLVFRAFGSNDQRRPVLLIAALILFVMVCCLLLFIVSR